MSVNLYTHSEAPWTLTDVALVVKKQDLDPDFITSFLRIQPTSTRRPGPNRWMPDADADGVWQLQCDERTSRDLDEQLDFLLSAIEPRSRELQDLRSSGYETVLRVYGFASNGSTFQLSPATVLRMSKLGITLTVVANINER